MLKPIVCAMRWVPIVDLFQLADHFVLVNHLSQFHKFVIFAVIETKIPKILETKMKLEREESLQ